VIIEDCFIEEEHRRRGIATALMRQVREWAHSQGIRRIHLQVWGDNRPAMHLYRKLEYRDLLIRMELNE